MISQPRIAVLGLSQPYVFIDDCLLITSSSCTRVRTYLQFKLRFKPSAYLYLKTSSKTKDRHLGLLQSLLNPNSSSITPLPTKPCQYLLLQGEPSVFTPCARIKKCPCA